MKKFIAQVLLEATSPLVIGSGHSTYDNDAIVSKDFNFLPYIPGTGLTGILSSFFEKEFGSDKTREFFGGEDDVYKRNEKETFKGSEIEISDALLVDDDGKVIQNVISTNQLSGFHKRFLMLPKREHVRINERGVGEKHGKFENEFVYKGARFKFEMELMAEGDDEWNFILNSLYSKDFLLGGGITENFGQVKIKSIRTQTFDLSDETQFQASLAHSSDLNQELEGKEFIREPFNENWKNVYSLQLEAKTIHIGSGFGDNDVDDANYKEYVIEWDTNDKPIWKYCFVIPGSSIKGVVAHRVAYYQNKNNCVETFIDNYRKSKDKDYREEVNKIFASLRNKIDAVNNEQISAEEKITKLNEYKEDVKKIDFKIDFDTKKFFNAITGENNVAVKELFGNASNFNQSNGNTGKVIFDDFYIPLKNVYETIFVHNSIDSFSGATVESALFSEKIITPDIPITINVKIFKGGNKNEQFSKSTTEKMKKVMDDLKSGNLAIGGKTNKGYGFLYEPQKQ